MQTGSFNYTHAPKEPWATTRGCALLSRGRFWPLWSHTWSRNVEAAAPRLQGAEVKPEPPAWASRCGPTELRPQQRAYHAYIYLRAIFLALPIFKIQKIDFILLKIHSVQYMFWAVKQQENRTSFLWPWLRCWGEPCSPFRVFKR